jgi:hypothetical protein
MNFFQQSMQQEQDFRLALWAIASGTHVFAYQAKPATANAPWQAVHSKVALLSRVRGWSCVPFAGRRCCDSPY